MVRIQKRKEKEKDIKMELKDVININKENELSNKVNNNKVNNKDEIEIKDFNKGIHIKKPLKLAPLPNIPEEKRLNYIMEVQPLAQNRRNLL